MATPRISYQRRRSQSASHSISPSTSRRSIGDSYRVASKRAHPHHQTSLLHPDAATMQKWDLDVWRRSKRRRQDSSPSGGSMDVDLNAPPASCHSPLPSTSAAFQLFPKGEHRTTKSRRFTYYSGTLPDIASDMESDLKQLRSHAFWELHQSVAESGEGFIRRMRDYENSRTRSDAHYKAREAQRRGWKRSSLVSASRKTSVIESRIDADDDEIQILGSEFAAITHKRSHSTGSSHTDAGHPLVPDIRSASPGATCYSSSSGYASDEEEFVQPQSVLVPGFPSYPPEIPVSHTPALTHANTDSARSSVVSLPLQSLPLSSSVDQSPRVTALPASRTEKAIAALSLAMANGAAGLNDYEALRAVQAPFLIDECQVGEMWD